MRRKTEIRVVLDCKHEHVTDESVRGCAPFWCAECRCTRHIVNVYRYESKCSGCSFSRTGTRSDAEYFAEVHAQKTGHTVTVYDQRRHAVSVTTPDTAPML